MAYKITRRAANDISEIFEYTLKKWSKEQALRYYKLIFDEIQFQADFPDSGKNFTPIREGYKSSKVKSHLIFYRCITGENDIEIIRILHERMDIKNRLLENF